MTVSNALKLVLHWTGLGEEGTLAWYFSGGAAGKTPDQLGAAAGNAVSHWGSDRTPSSKTQFLSMLGTSQSVDKVTLYAYDTLPGNATELGVFAVTGWTGTGASARGPLQTAVCCTLLTATAGASFRGRQYFPGHALPAVNIATGLFASGDIDTYASCASNMGVEAQGAINTSLGLANGTWCIYSPKRGVMTPVTQCKVDNIPDTQRRRAGNLKPTYTKLVTA